MPIATKISDTQNAPGFHSAPELQKSGCISPSGLRMIAADMKKTGGLTVSNASVDILSIFRMTGFDKKLIRI